MLTHLSLKDQSLLLGERDGKVIEHFIFIELRTGEFIPHSRNEGEDSRALKTWRQNKQYSVKEDKTISDSLKSLKSEPISKSREEK